MSNSSHSRPVPVADQLDGFILKFSHLVAWCYAALILTIITQVVLRKGFSNGLIALEELQWHLYAVGVMFGVSYAQINNAHVRVDLFHSGFSLRTKRIIEITGTLTLILPFIGVVFLHSLDFVADSWRINESSDSPSGLPWRWVIKSVIPFSFALLALAVISRLIRDSVQLARGE